MPFHEITRVTKPAGSSSCFFFFFFVRLDGRTAWLRTRSVAKRSNVIDRTDSVSPRTKTREFFFPFRTNAPIFDQSSPFPSTFTVIIFRISFPCRFPLCISPTVSPLCRYDESAIRQRYMGGVSRVEFKFRHALFPSSAGRVQFALVRDEKKNFFFHLLQPQAT